MNEWLEMPDVGMSKISDFPEYVRALTVVRLVAAKANCKIGKLTSEQCAALNDAAQYVGDHAQELFANDSIYGGLGKRLNRAVTNALVQVLADSKTLPLDREAIELNQADNDVTATAVELAIGTAFERTAASALAMAEVLQDKAEEFAEVVTCGRVGLTDDVPVTLRQKFHTYAATIRRCAQTVKARGFSWNQCHLGAGDLGTGLGIDPAFEDQAAKEMTEVTSKDWVTPVDRAGGLVLSDRLIDAHAALEMLAFSIWKMTHDFEFMASGPRGGIREIILPAVAPGSSIMPGKINPTVAELGMGICNRILADREALIQGLHHGWTDATPESSLPVKTILFAANILARMCDVLVVKLIRGITSNPENTLQQAKSSLALYKTLIPIIGESKAQEVLQKARHEDLTIEKAVIEMGVLDAQKAQEVLDVSRLADR